MLELEIAATSSSPRASALIEGPPGFTREPERSWGPAKGGSIVTGLVFSIVLPAQLEWRTRPHERGEPARHVAELQEAIGFERTRANVWRYEPGAHGRRHVHVEQEETFVVLAGRLTIYLGEPPQRHVLPRGGVVHVQAGTALQTVNDGSEDLVVYAYGSPPDEGAQLLPSATAGSPPMPARGSAPERSDVP
jgi:quercetin dioxygenase-like cupin family protein